MFVNSTIVGLLQLFHSVVELSYFGHIKRHNTLEKLFLEGTCEGRRGRGRPRRRWTQDIGEWMGVSTVEAGRQALERGEFRQAVWEATSIKDPPQKKKWNYQMFLFDLLSLRCTNREKTEDSFLTCSFIKAGGCGNVRGATLNFLTGCL